MPEEPGQPDSKKPTGGSPEPPKIRIKGPGEKSERPEIKIRKVADSDQEASPTPPEPQGGNAGDSAGKKKATVRINLPGAKPAAPAAPPAGPPDPAQAAQGEKKQIRVRVDQGAVPQKPPAAASPGGDLPQSVRIRGPKGDSQQINLASSSSAPTAPATPDGGAKADKAIPAPGKPKGSDEAAQPQGKTAARLVKPQAATGVSQDRAPSYAGGIAIKRKKKDAGPVVGTFSALAAVVGLAVVYLLLAQALPDLGLPVLRLF